MQDMSFSTFFSARQASAQAVQVSTQAKQASMQWLMTSAWLGWSGCERNMFLTAVADIFRFPINVSRPRIATFVTTVGSGKRKVPSINREAGGLTLPHTLPNEFMTACR
jgi:hypothetical protein